MYTAEIIKRPLKHMYVMLCSYECGIHGCVGANDVQLMNKRSQISIVQK